jgi:putative NIF3 family GTP cyclohydrolase 1 type 2
MAIGWHIRSQALTISFGQFAQNLDDLFEVRHFDERSNWDFALDSDQRLVLTRRGGSTFQACFNGLLNMPDEEREFERVYLAVFPEESLLNHIIVEERSRDCPGAVVLTHHPCDMETSGRGFIPIPEYQLVQLSEAKIALYVLHAPLDCHAQISTSGALADGLGLKRTDVFAPYVGGHAGVIGEQPPERFDAFADRVKQLCEIPYFDPGQVRFNGRMVFRVAIVAGGGDDLVDLAEAESLGADTFLAGHWWTPHEGKWADDNRRKIAEALPGFSMNLLSASHDGSELIVFRDRLAPLIASWGIETVLIRQADHWR